MSELSPVKMTLRANNHRLMEARRAKGWAQIEFAKYICMSIQKYQEVELMRYVPSHMEMFDIAEALETTVEYLFPETLIDSIKSGVFRQRVKFVEEPEILRLTEPSAQKALSILGGIVEEDAIYELDRRALSITLAELFNCKLKENEREILALRFGLNGGEPMTHEKIGCMYGVSGERIRQIEARALRQLRYRDSSEKLKPFLD